MAIMRTCAYDACDTQFKVQTNPDQRFCSKTCFGKSLSLREVRVCARDECSNKFKTKPASKQRFCSQSCGGKRPRYTKICARCGSTFTVTFKSNGRKYCDSICGRRRASVPETRTCERDGCGTQFTVRVKVRRRFCCQRCAYMSMTKRTDMKTLTCARADCGQIIHNKVGVGATLLQ